jgi:hypothetical protein
MREKENSTPAPSWLDLSGGSGALECLCWRRMRVLGRSAVPANVHVGGLPDVMELLVHSKGLGHAVEVLVAVLGVGKATTDR